MVREVLLIVGAVLLRVGWAMEAGPAYYDR